jgi:hypothetical protein
LTDVTALAGLVRVHTLNLQYCTRLRTVAGAHGLTSLRILNASGCLSLCDITSLSALTELTNVNLWKTQIHEVSSLTCSTNMRALDLTMCDRLRPTNLAPLCRLTRLRTLWVDPFQSETPPPPRHTYTHDDGRLNVPWIMEYLARRSTGNYQTERQPSKPTNGHAYMIGLHHTLLVTHPLPRTKLGPTLTATSPMTPWTSMMMRTRTLRTSTMTMTQVGFHFLQFCQRRMIATSSTVHLDYSPMYCHTTVEDGVSAGSSEDTADFNDIE